MKAEQENYKRLKEIIEKLTDEQKEDLKNFIRNKREELRRRANE